MSVGLTVLLRWLAVLGMLLAFVDFTFVTVEWTQRGGPDGQYNQANVRRRVEYSVMSDNGKVTWFAASPSTAPDGWARLKSTQIAVRRELATWLGSVRGSGQWFCLCGILYLFAGRQLAEWRRGLQAEQPG